MYGSDKKLDIGDMHGIAYDIGDKIISAKEYGGEYHEYYLLITYCCRYNCTY